MSDKPHSPLLPPTVRWWHRPNIRACFFQAVVITLIIIAILGLTHNVQVNLARQGIASGFAFLNNTAGFGIIMHLIDYSERDSYGRVFIVGLLNTLLVSILSIVLATCLGVIIGVARLSSNWLAAKLSMLYIEIFRNIPLLLQIFFWYFAVLRSVPGPRNSLTLGEFFVLNNRGLYIPKPIFESSISYVILVFLILSILSIALMLWSRYHRRLTGHKLKSSGYFKVVLWIGFAASIGFALSQSIHFDYPEFRTFNYRGGVVLIPELIALMLALSIYTAAFIAEVVRAGLSSVDKGQLEAAKSLGLSFGLTLRLIIFPQAMRVIIPPLTNQYLNLAKNSSLAAAIAYPDLVSVFAGTVLNQTGQAVEVIALTMAVYLTMSLTISLIMNIYNKYHARWEG